MDRPLVLMVVAYLVPTFVLGFVWHLKLFDGYYRQLEIYRPNLLIPFGIAAILLQGIVFAWTYLHVVADPASFESGLRFAAAAAVLSWTFTTLAVGAKHPMTSVSRFVRIETAFTIVHFLIVGLLFPLSVRAS